MSDTKRVPRLSRSLAALRECQWSAGERAFLVSVLAIALAALYVTTYTPALGNPAPRGIPIAIIGDPAAEVSIVDAVAQVAGGPNFRVYDTLPAALNAVDWQAVYAALDLTADQPTLYVASAAGASVTRALECVTDVAPSVTIIDTHPLGSNDPAGLDVFYLMLGTTILGFVTAFQVRANAQPLTLRQWSLFVIALALCGALVLTLVAGPLLRRLELPVMEVWLILTLQLVAAASFASLMIVLLGPWAIVPTWAFFVILGNSSSGGATVTALRNAVYFPDHQHLQPVAVLAAWPTGLFIAMIAVSRRRGMCPGTL